MRQVHTLPVVHRLPADIRATAPCWSITAAGDVVFADVRTFPHRQGTGLRDLGCGPGVVTTMVGHWTASLAMPVALGAALRDIRCLVMGRSSVTLTQRRRLPPATLASAGRKGSVSCWAGPIWTIA